MRGMKSSGKFANFKKKFGNPSEDSTEDFSIKRKNKTSSNKGRLREALKRRMTNY